MVVSGNIDSLSEKYDNVIDIECTMEGNSDIFMDNICRFVCAVLNTRYSKRVGVLLGGVKETDSDRDCQFRDSSDRTQTECYKCLEGDTVHIRQLKRITELKTVSIKIISITTNPSSLFILTVMTLCKIYVISHFLCTCHVQLDCA